MEQTEPKEHWIGLQTITEREGLLLASYAMHSRDSVGRRYAEPAHPYRGPYQRDRDRILHSAAFRRLSGKTQVFTGNRGDYHRTRLTHTMEVASVARTIGRTLRLNEDLIEALALLHDIGHPPFGHAGEDTLNDCLIEEGGFSHNRYALTLVEDLENRYPSFPGLNLTLEVLSGQMARIDKSADAPNPLLEVQVVDLADSIAYNAHDVDDALKLGLVRIDELMELPMIRQAARKAADTLPECESPQRQAIVHELIDRQVSDALMTSGAHMSRFEGKDAESMRRSGFKLAFSDELRSNTDQLHEFLYDRVYRHPEIIHVRERAQQWLSTMFHGYQVRTELLPEEFQGRSEQVGLRRNVADYLAGMTDRYCVEQYERYFSKGHTG